MCISVFSPFGPCARVLRQAHPSQTVSSVGRSLVFLSLPWLSTGKRTLQTTSWEEDEEKGLASLFIGDESLLKLTPNLHTTPVTASTCRSEVGTFPFSGCALNDSSSHYNPPHSGPVSIHFSATDLWHSQSFLCCSPHTSVCLSFTSFRSPPSIPPKCRSHLLRTSLKMLPSLQSAPAPSRFASPHPCCSISPSAREHTELSCSCEITPCHEEAHSTISYL